MEEQSPWFYPEPCKRNKEKQPSQTELSEEKTQLNNLIVWASQYQFWKFSEL